MTGCIPAHSDRRLIANVEFRIPSSGNQWIDAESVYAVLKTGPPESMVVHRANHHFRSEYAAGLIAQAKRRNPCGGNKRRAGWRGRSRYAGAGNAQINR